MVFEGHIVPDDHRNIEGVTPKALPAPDASCFAANAPDGFLLGDLAGVPPAIYSVVNYDEHFSFLGFYIVRPTLRALGCASLKLVLVSRQ